MRFNIPALARSVSDVDFSDITSASQQGDASWVSDGVLDIPFDHDPTEAEVAAILLRLTSRTGTQEAWRKASQTYLALPSTSPAQDSAQIKVLTRLVLELLNQEA